MTSPKLRFVRCFLFGILLVLLSFQTLSAESEPHSDNETAEDSPLMLENPTLPFKVQPYFDYPAASIYFGSPDLEGYAYVPNSSPRLGLTLGVKRFEISYASNLPLPPEEVRRRGQTRQSTFIFQSRFRAFAFEVYSQMAEGLYTGNPFSELDSHRAEVCTQLPSAKIRNQGINFYYSTHPDLYSFENSLNQRNVQRSSGASLVFVPYVQKYLFESGQDLVIGKEANPLRELPSLRKVDLLSLGLLIGPGVHWDFESTGYYLAVQWVLGPGIQHQKISEFEIEGQSQFAPVAKTNLNSFVGYNDISKTFGLKIFAEGFFSRIYGTDTYSTLILFTAFYGHRF